LRISIVTIFPEMFPGFLDSGMVRVGAGKSAFLDVQVINLRELYEGSPPHDR